MGNFSRASTVPIEVCSDLDGLMVGDVIGNGTKVAAVEVPLPFLVLVFLLSLVFGEANGEDILDFFGGLFFLDFLTSGVVSTSSALESESSLEEELELDSASFFTADDDNAAEAADLFFGMVYFLVFSAADEAADFLEFLVSELTPLPGDLPADITLAPNGFPTGCVTNFAFMMTF